jgi:hypothetical protein
MGFTRRFEEFPGLNIISAIEGVVIVDQNEPPANFGVGQGMAVLIGEFLKGVPNSIYRISTQQVLLSNLGGYKLVSPEDETLPEGAPIIPDNGNGFLAVTNKVWASLGVVRVDMRVTEDGSETGTKVAAEISVTGAPADSSIIVPAGTRVSDNATLSSATRVFATDQDYVIETDGAGDGLVTGVGMVNVFGAGLVPSATPMFVNDLAWLESGAAGVVMNSDAQELDAAGIDTRYQAAIDATVGNGTLQNLVTVLWAARESEAIRAALKLNAITVSKTARGRIAIIRPPFTTSSTPALDTPDPGVGAYASDRVRYAYPAVESNVSVAGGQRVMGADGFVASLFNNLPPERNVGEPTNLLSAISGFAEQILFAGDVQPENYTQAEYETFKAAGVMALIFDRDNLAWQVQSDVTTDPAKPSSKRRTMADFIQDSLKTVVSPYVKKLATDERVDQITSQIDQFLDSLLSPTNPSFQRIKAYSVDSKSGNTLELNGAGIFVWKVKVRTLSSLDDIVLAVTVGESVVVEQLAA